MVSLTAIRQALARHPTEPPPPSRSVAAVAMALAGPSESLSLCFILRAARPGDRWSGQMALPGGKVEASDPTTEATAIRETAEEVGLSLDGAETLGPLPTVSMRPMGGALGTLAPFAFYLGESLPSLAPNAGEVDRAWWIPVADLWHSDRRTRIDWEHKGQWYRFPGIRFEDQVIWGLTRRVLVQWSKQLDRPLPGAEDKPIVRL